MIFDADFNLRDRIDQSQNFRHVFFSSLIQGYYHYHVVLGRKNQNRKTCQ
jgi:hypothetical protein